MANKLKDWSQEGCSTTGVGDLILSGVLSINQTRFRDGFNSENVYYSISDGANREAGIGAFNGSDRITRSEVHATLVNGVFNNSNPTAISLSGEAVVSGTFNTDAYDSIVNDITTLAGQVATNTNTLASHSNLLPTQSQKDAMTVSVNPSASNRYITGDELGPINGHISDPTGAHAASAISNVGTGTMPTTDVQGSLEILDTRIADHLSDPIAAHEASAIRYDDLNSELQAIDVQEAIDELSEAFVILEDDVSFRESAVSALETGGEVYQNGNTVVTIDAGSGEIIDSYSDPENQVTKDITWGQQNYDLLANAGMPVVSGLGFTEVGMDINGIPTLAANGFTSAQRRTIVMLALVEYFDQVITAVTFTPIVSNQSGNLLLDLIDYIDLGTRLKGMLLRPTEALGLTTWRDSGTLFSPGINYVNAKDDQNVAQIVAQGAPDTSMPAHVPVLFNNGSSLGIAATQTIDNNQYEPNGVGTLNAISNGKTVIHYMYESLGGGFYMSYAQQQYDTYDEAKSSLFTDMASHKTPVEFSRGILLAQIVVQKGATSWGVSAEIFPLASSTSSGSGSGSAANAINVAYTDTYALGNNVQSALDSLAALKLTTDQHLSLAAASGGTYPPTGSNAIATLGDVNVNTGGLSDHIAGTNGKHFAPAIGFTSAGSIIATDVDGALLELDSDIGVNAGNISTNTFDISDNATDISGLTTGKVNKSGDTMTGQLKGITPVAIDDLTRKDYVDSAVSGTVAGKIDRSGDTMAGQLKGITPVSIDDFTRKDYVDGRVSKSGDTMSGALLGVTPTADEHLTRKDYVDDTVSGALAGFTGRNLLINGDFSIWQRGDEQLETGVHFSADMWQGGSNGFVGRKQEHSDTQSGCALQATDNASDHKSIKNAIELKAPGNAGPFQIGTKVAISLKVRANVINGDVTLNLSFRDGYNGNNVWFPNIEMPGVISTADTWIEVSGVVYIDALPNASNTALVLGITGRNANLASVFEFADVQVEIGEGPTPLEEIPIATQLARCRRYCITMDSGATFTAFAGGAADAWTTLQPVSSLNPAGSNLRFESTNTFWVYTLSADKRSATFGGLYHGAGSLKLKAVTSGLSGSTMLTVGIEGPLIIIAVDP